MRMLHLIDAASPLATPGTLALLKATADAQVRDGHDVHVLLLGGASLDACARAVGLVAEPPPAPHPPLRRAQADPALAYAHTDMPVHRLAIPFGRAGLGITSLRARQPQLPAPEHVFTWSTETLRAATTLYPQTPRTFCALQSPDRATHLALFGSQQHPEPDATHVVVLHEHIVEHLQRHPRALHIVVPDAPVCPPLPAANENRAILREQWSGDRPAHGEFVVALLSDPPMATDAADGMLTIGLVREALGALSTPQPRIALLVHPAQRRRLLAQRVVEKVPTPIRLVQDARLAAPWQVLAGCDAALCPDPAGATLCPAIAMQAGCPLVTVPGSHHPGVQHESTALIAAGGSTKHLAIELQRLVLDPQLGQRLGESGRRAAGDIRPWLRAINATSEQATTTEPEPGTATGQARS